MRHLASRWAFGRKFPDGRARRKREQEQHSSGRSTITYLQRYTLKAALGLAAAEDDDGKQAGRADEEDIPLLDAAQLKAIRDLIAAANTTEDAFCAHIKVEALEDVYARNYQRICGILEQRIAQGRA